MYVRMDVCMYARTHAMALFRRLVSLQSLRMQAVPVQCTSTAREQRQTLPRPRLSWSLLAVIACQVASAAEAASLAL